MKQTQEKSSTENVIVTVIPQVKERRGKETDKHTDVFTRAVAMTAILKYHNIDKANHREEQATTTTTAMVVFFLSFLLAFHFNMNHHYHIK